MLARLKRLRGGRLDLFGYAPERRLERALIGEYEHTVALLLDGLGPHNHALAIEIAAIAQHMRGFGPVKQANVHAAREQTQHLLAQYRNPRPVDHAA